MYAWLAEALEGIPRPAQPADITEPQRGEGNSCLVVTANLRLARTLKESFGAQQVRNGVAAWKTPQIHAWGHWIQTLLESADADQELPSRLNKQQSRVLWDRCIQQEVDESVVNVASLGRLARDAWVRMNEWNLEPDVCANAAQGQDQRIFARAMQRYCAELRNHDWIDAESLPSLLCRLITQDKIITPQRLTLSGFDRITPQVRAVLDALQASGTQIDTREPGPICKNFLYRCDNPDAELRAAGAWAARELASDPALRIAVVVSNLDSGAAYSGRLLREGFVPGWQYGGRTRAAAVNVSYGRKLADYPAIQTALLALRWLVGDLTGAEISLLLRSPFVGAGPAHGRSRLELLLRDLPDRHWNPDRLLGALRGCDDSADAEDWVMRMGKLNERRTAMSGRARPSTWARLVDDVLTDLNWPGDDALNSVDFQLVNRWRDLLNEFAQVELVAPQMSAAGAVARITAIASDTLFQAETEGAVIHVLGPLEAAGMEFDRLWVAGLSADDWPPQGRPSPLLSRELQLQHAMPDSDPRDTANYARRVLNRLRASADVCHLSYASTAADHEQLPTALLADLSESTAPPDPGWHAQDLLHRVAMQEIADSAPALLADEVIRGGAATINKQLSEPFSAFAFGRLEVTRMQSFTAGIAPNVRGNLVHAALSNLYAHRPAQKDIQAWDATKTSQRIEQAIDKAFARHERFADRVLRQLFKLERQRTASLLQGVVELDCERDAFRVDTVERSIAGSIGPMTISLRCDRIDELQNSDIVILDYKTGAAKKFLTSGEPNDMQLVVYACITDRQVAGLGLFNVDSKWTGIDGAGPALKDIDGWQSALDGWKDEVRGAAKNIARGDVRINAAQSNGDARPLNLLSRFSELTRER